MTVFNNYAKYYDLLYRDKDYVGEAAYVHDIIQKYSPHATSVLNLGCGTGRHDFLLAKKGYSVTGVDMSEEMLAAANSQLAGKRKTDTKIKIKAKIRTKDETEDEGPVPDPVPDLSFIHGDVRDVRLNRMFDVVLSLFHVMSYQTGNEDITSAFETAKAHLKPGGILVFDFWYGPAVLTDRPVVRVKRLENKDLSIHRIATPEMHVNENVVDVNYEVLIEDKKTRTLGTLKETHRMRYFFLPELEFMLGNTGFSIVEELQWMSLDKKPGPESWNVVLVARK